MRSPVLLLAVLSVAGHATLAAQTPVSMTLDEAVARGLAAAPRVAAAKAREAAADAQVAAQSAAGSPTVSSSAGYLRTNHVQAFGLTASDGSFHTVFPDIPDNFQVQAGVNVPLYTSGRVDALVASAKDARSAAGADRTATEADLRLEIATAYWTLVTARASVTVLEQAVERAGAAVSDAKARVDAGFRPPSDQRSAEAERARESVQLIDARHAAALAEVVLDRLTGLPLGTPVAAASSVEQADARATDLAQQPIPDLVARAGQSRPELEALRRQAASLDASSDAARDATKPMVGASGTVEPARPNQLFVPRRDQWKTSWSVGVNVSWALWDGGRARAEAAASTAQADALRRQADDVDASIAVDVRRCLLDLTSDRAAVAAAAEGVAAATEAHRVVAERFRAGVATSSDVLEAETALLQASLEQTRLAAAARLDEARLIHAVGGRP